MRPKVLQFDLAIVAIDSQTVEIQAKFSDPDDTLDRPVIAARAPAAGLGDIDPQDPGRALSDWLFQSAKVRDAFTLAVGRLDAGEWLRLRIILPEDDERLNSLPWERLVEPGGDKALATLPQVAFSRFIASQDLTPVGPPPRRQALRVLVMIAAPPLLADAYGKVDVEKERRTAAAALEPLGLQLDFLVTNPASRATLAALLERLEAGYDFVYLICHGTFLKGTPRLLLEDEAGQGTLAPVEPLLDRVRHLGGKRPRLVVLTACESGGTGERLPASNSALAALGPRLVQAGVPAVVAMQGQVRMETAAEFLKTFFREICDHGVVDLAGTPARSGARAAQYADWWMPVIFMNLKDGRLWGEPAGGEDRPTAPLLPGSEVFVGRASLFQELKQELMAVRKPTQAPGPGSVGNRSIFVFLHTPGIGKTELALQLANDPDLQRAFDKRVLWVTLGPDAGSKIVGLLGLWLQDLNVPLEQIALLKTEAERKNVLKGRIGLTKMLLIVDDVWDYADARYFLDIGVNCTYVVTTRLEEVFNNIHSDHLRSTVEEIVGELSEAESMELLHQLTPQVVELYPEKARELVRAMGGLPLGLVVVGKYLYGAARSARKPELDRALRKLKGTLRPDKLTIGKPYVGKQPGQPLARLHAAIELSLERLDPQALQVLRQISIFLPKLNCFSFEEAAYVCGVKGEGEEELLMDRLFQIRDVGLLEQIPESNSFTIQRVIADYVNSQLSEEESQELHFRAAGYYQQLFRSYEESKKGDHSAYVRNYEYEHPDWQRLKSRWLYHLSHVKPAIANQMFARLYLDAFWWWGCYRDFPFCHQLLEAWGDARTKDEDRKMLRLLRSFQQAYPVGYDKRGKGNWDAVEAALLALRQTAGVGGELSWLDEDQAHLRAISNLFLAESRRFRNLQDPQADAYYHEALHIFRNGADEDDDDAWNVPWVLWHQGDLALERGQFSLALDKARESRLRAQAAGVQTQWDNEIIANGYRVKADVRWQTGDVEGAFQAYALAVLFAYAFQASPKPADFYTLDFYAEMTTRTLLRLDELWSAGQRNPVLQACATLHDFWRPYWNALGLPSGMRAEQAGWDAGGWQALVRPAAPGRAGVEAYNQLDELERAARTRYLFPAPPCETEVKAAEAIEDPRRWPVYFRRARALSRRCFRAWINQEQ